MHQNVITQNPCLLSPNSLFPSSYICRSILLIVLMGDCGDDIFLPVSRSLIHVLEEKHKNLGLVRNILKIKKKINELNKQEHVWWVAFSFQGVQYGVISLNEAYFPIFPKLQCSLC